MLVEEAFFFPLPYCLLRIFKEAFKGYLNLCKAESISKSVTLSGDGNKKDLISHWI